MRNILKIIFISILSFGSVVAADNKELWDSASENYDAGDYLKAIESYSKLIEKGYTSPQLYYNLGNAYFKSGSLGGAIWSYRRALKLDPGMEQARANLNYVREFNIDKIEVKGQGFITDIWTDITNAMSSNSFVIIFMAAWWAIGLALFLIILRPVNSYWPHYLLILGLVVAILSGAASYTRITKDKLTRWGVLAADTADIREGPGSDFEKIEVGHEGLEFKILREREGDFLIELRNGLKGWVPTETVLEI